MCSSEDRTWTNRDLYLFVADLIKTEEKNGRSLEEYLRALWSLGRHRSSGATIKMGTFTGLLKAAFHEAPAPFDPRWSHEHRGGHEGEAGFGYWKNTLLSQVVDLREMHDAGTLASKVLYFGADAPSGLRWYNFDPCTFLECAAVGTYGGWEPSDETGRVYVPGPVAILDGEGQLVSCDPREIDDPVVPLDQISWEDFAEFPRNG